MRSLSIVIATYQRRDSLAALFDRLGSQLAADPELTADLDVIVVIDGSTDGSFELCDSIDLPVPVKHVWQRNRGRASARNVGLGLATGELVCLLDDDVRPLPGLLRRHRVAHEQSAPHVLMGPHLAVRDPADIAPNQEWVDHIYGEMAATGLVARADWFSTANASGEVEIFRGVGGFDEGFTGWGFEDAEIGQRILAAGHIIRFDPEARAEHAQQLTTAQFCANNVAAGRALVRLLRLHPEMIDQLLPAEPTLASRRSWRMIARALFRVLPLRSPLVYRTIAAGASSGARLERSLTQNQSQRCLYVAMAASTLAGIAEADPGGALLARKLGVGPGR
jgi:glycosyltransferase involved in cell wall biosynthesis